MIDKIITRDDSVRIEQQQLKKVEYHLIKQERRIRGLTLFSYNLVTGETKQAEIVYCKDVDFITRLPVHSPKVTIEPNCIYRQALNKKNFLRKLKKEGII